MAPAGKPPDRRERPINGGRRPAELVEVMEVALGVPGHPLLDPQVVVGLVVPPDEAAEVAHLGGEGVVGLDAGHLGLEVADHPSAEGSLTGEAGGGDQPLSTRNIMSHDFGPNIGPGFHGI